MLRTLGGKNIGKCRLRAHQHPLLPPLSNQRPHILPQAYLQSGSSNERMLKIACCMHRFLISGPDLRIDARFSLFTPSYVHRFLISGSDLRIDASFSPFTSSSVHRFLISGPDLGIDASFSPIPPSCVHRFLISGPHLGIDAAPSLLHRRMARLQQSRWVQAGTGCHKGGIILSKKPPKWRPVESTLRVLLCGKVEWFRLP